MIEENIFGIRIVNESLSDVCELILGFASCSNACRVVVTPNVDHYVRICSSKWIREIYTESDICVNDSRVMALLVAIFLNFKISVVTGSDLTSQILEKISGLSRSIAIVGSDARNVKLLLEKYSLQNASILHIEPSFGFVNDPDELVNIVERIAEVKPEFIFLAVGSPQQEILARMIKNVTNNGVVLCIGASIDYLTGKEKRAPLFIQNISLEWLYRFLQSPRKRFYRYFINCPKIIYYLIKERRNLLR